MVTATVFDSAGLEGCSMGVWLPGCHMPNFCACKGCGAHAVVLDCHMWASLICQWDVSKIPCDDSQSSWYRF